MFQKKLHFKKQTKSQIFDKYLLIKDKLPLGG